MVEDGILQEIITTYIQSNVAWTFDTVADMKLATNLVNGSFAQTLGFYSNTDKGGAIYKITDTGPANEMDVIAVGNNLFAHLVIEPSMNVKQFGAKGDGTNNDYPFINQAITQCDNINLPSGTYIVNSTLYIPSNKQITGDGDSTIIKSGTTDHIIIFDTVVNSSINNLKIDGDADNKQTAGTLSSAIYGISIDFSKYITVENITFTNLGYLPQTYGGQNGNMGIGGNMLSLNVNEEYDDKTNTEYCTVNNCKFIDPLGRSSFGIRVWSNWDLSSERKYYVQNNTISNCYFEGNNYNNIELAGQGVRYNIIDNCTVKNSKSIVTIEADKGASYNIFSNHIIDGVECTNAQNIQAFNCAGYENEYAIGNQFSNIIIKNVKFNTSSSCSGFALSHCKDTTLDNILIENLIRYQTSTNGMGIRFDAAEDATLNNITLLNGEGSNGFQFSLTNVKNINITNATCDNFNYGVRTYAEQPANTIIKIENCIFKNIAAHGINLGDGVKHFLIANCSFLNLPVGVSMQAGSESVVVNNSFRNITGNGHFAIDARNANSICANGNFIDGAYLAFTATNLNNRIGQNMTVNSIGNYNKSITYGSAAPSTGDWHIGDIIYNQTPTAGGNIGWVCTTAGTPGTWKEFGSIAA